MFEGRLFQIIGPLKKIDFFAMSILVNGKWKWEELRVLYEWNWAFIENLLERLGGMVRLKHNYSVHEYF